MRTGAIFARGICRALKWMALVGMVFALGAGGAAAQVNVDDGTGAATSVALAIVEGATDTFDVTLTTAPTTATSVTITSSDATAATVHSSPATVGAAMTTVTIDTSNTPVTVTVTAVEDTDTAGETVTITAAAAGQAPATVAVTLTDNDSPSIKLVKEDGTSPILPNPLMLDEGGSVRYGVLLSSEPTADVTIDIAIDPSTGTDLTLDRSSVTLTRSTWNIPHYVVVSAAEDVDLANDIAALTHTDSAVGTPPDPAVVRLPVTVTDNDVVGVTVSTSNLTVIEGGTASYTVRLGSQPTANVTVVPALSSVNNASLTLSPSSLNFAPGNYNLVQTVTVTAAVDNNLVDGTAKISHTVTSTDGFYNAIAVGDVAVRELDTADDRRRTVMLTVNKASVIEGGGASEKATVTARLVHPDPAFSGPTTALTTPVMVTFKLKASASSKTLESGDYTLGTLTIPAGTEYGTAVLSAHHDMDAADETLVFSSTVTGGGDAIFTDNTPDDISLVIMDDDTYTLTAKKYELDEGDAVELTVKLSPAAALATNVDIDLFRASGATVAPSSRTIGVGGTQAKFTLTTAKDPNDKNHETIVARARVAGKTVVGDSIEISVTDAEADAMYEMTLTPDAVSEQSGETMVSVMVMADKVISASKDTVLKLAVEDSSTATADVDYTMGEFMDITIKKGTKSGMVMWTVTPMMDSMEESDETIVLSAWKGTTGVAEATLTLFDTDPVDVGITPKSNDEVLAIVEKAIMDVGGMQAGGMSASVDMSMLFNVDDPSTVITYSASSTAEDVLMAHTMADDPSIAATYLKLEPMMEGTATITVMAHAGGMMVSSLSAVSCTVPCVSFNVDVGPAGTPVPALPLVGQGLLALFLFGAGAYRRYRSR